MANTSNGFLTTQELDFTSYVDQLTTFLSQQDQFKDYDFKGSNLRVLIELLAYNTYMQGTYLNLVGSEMFLDTATMREAIVSHAKELNYTPRSRSSSSVILDIKVSGNNLPDSLVIPTGYKISGRAANGQVFGFITSENLVVGSSNNYTASNVSVYEGRLITETFITNAGVRYILSSANVDISSIQVNVQNSVTDTSNTDWKRATTLFGLQNDTNAFFVQGYKDYQYEVVFGNGIVGKALTPGNVVKITYRDTNGADANGIRIFSADQAVQGFSNVSVSLSADNVASTGGSDHESDDEIKFNAPRYFETQERAVTTSDYVTLLKNQFPTIETVTAYGGDQVEPKQYGKCIISAKVQNSTVVSDSLKAAIINFLKERTSLSIDPVFVDPDYFNVAVTSVVNYNANKTVKTPTDIRSLVSNSISTFNTLNLSTFGNDLYYSKFLRSIDDSDASIISNETQLRMLKKLYPFLNTVQNFSFTFGNVIYSDSTDRYQYSTTHDPVVYSGSFGYSVGGTTYNAFIQDDGIGNLYVYTIDNTGSKVILNKNIGTVDYTNGTVKLTNLSVAYLNGASLNIYAKLENDDITVNNNQILLIEPIDVDITINGIRA